MKLWKKITLLLVALLAVVGFAAAGPATNEVPKLVFGVVSDTHIMMSYRGKGPSGRLDGIGFEQALKCFRDAKVDAVVHCGDWAHRGHIREMELSRDVWKRVFPKDSLPDGKKVAKLFITGNHDFFDVNEKSLQVYKTKEAAKPKMLRNDMTNQWQRIWGIPFADEGYKHCRDYEVKGYHFLAHHWSEKHYNELIGFSRKLKDDGKLKPDQPLFVLSHSILTPGVRRHFSTNFTSSVNIFGHWHRPHTNTNYGVNSKGFRMKCVETPCSRKDSPARQGYIVKVYEKFIVYECWDFNEKRKVLPDWVKPIAPPPKKKAPPASAPHATRLRQGYGGQGARAVQWFERNCVVPPEEHELKCENR